MPTLKSPGPSGRWPPRTMPTGCQPTRLPGSSARRWSTNTLPPSLEAADRLISGCCLPRPSTPMTSRSWRRSVPLTTSLMPPSLGHPIDFFMSSGELAYAAFRPGAISDTPSVRSWPWEACNSAGIRRWLPVCDDRSEGVWRRRDTRNESDRLLDIAECAGSHVRHDLIIARTVKQQLQRTVRHASGGPRGSGIWRPVSHLRRRGPGRRPRHQTGWIQ